MKCVKCDICGKIETKWFETQNSELFSYWQDGIIIEIKEVCYSCHTEIAKVIKGTVKAIRSEKASRDEL